MSGELRAALSAPFDAAAVERRTLASGVPLLGRTDIENDLVSVRIHLRMGSRWESDEEAGFWVRLIWLTGGMALLSDRMDEVAGPRGEMLTRVFPLNDRPAQWVDWYPEAGVQVLRAEGQPAMIGMFNLLDEPRTVELPAAKLGLGARRTMKEWLTGEQFVAEGDHVRFPALPPHSARIWIAE